MAEVYITKVSAAQRQIDAAIRMLFSGEDPLAVHTVTAAVHGIVIDLAEQRGQKLSDELHAVSLRSLYKDFLGRTPSDDQIRRDLPPFKKWIRSMKNRPANFLKHADQDAEKSLNPDILGTDDLLLEACALYADMGFDLTPEMYAFARWHLAVYPHEDADKLRTAAGQAHNLPRDAQIELGEFLLALYRENQQ